MFFSEKLTRLLSAGLHRAYSNEPSMLETITSLAQAMDVELPCNPEKEAAFRKLLEAKDCAVRAVLFKGE